MYDSLFVLYFVGEVSSPVVVRFFFSILGVLSIVFPYFCCLLSSGFGFFLAPLPSRQVDLCLPSSWLDSIAQWIRHLFNQRCWILYALCRTYSLVRASCRCTFSTPILKLQNLVVLVRFSIRFKYAETKFGIAGLDCRIGTRIQNWNTVS